MKQFIAIDLAAIGLLYLVGAPLWVVGLAGIALARQLCFYGINMRLKAKSFAQMDAGPNPPPGHRG
jgi:hypothetical protein